MFTRTLSTRIARERSEKIYLLYCKQFSYFSRYEKAIFNREQNIISYDLRLKLQRIILVRFQDLFIRSRWLSGKEPNAAFKWITFRRGKVIKLCILLSVWLKVSLTGYFRNHLFKKILSSF